MFGKSFFVSVLKAVCVALSAALVGILVFAFVIKVASLPSAAVKAVNQFIKVIAIFCGCFFCLKEDKGLLKGAITGVAFTCVIYLLFLLIDGSALKLSFFWADMAFGLVVGAISGIVSVNVKDRSR